MLNNLLFNSTFKCYSVSTLTAVRADLQGMLNESLRFQLKELVVEALYKELQWRKRSDSFFNQLSEDAGDYDMSDLENMIKVRHKYETVEVGETEFLINYLSIRCQDSDILKPLLFSFVTDIKSDNKYNTVLMARAVPKITNVLCKFLVNEKGVLLNQLKISSKMLQRCLNSAMEQIVKFHGDLELVFGHLHTINGSLSSITLNVPHSDLKKFASSLQSFTDELFKYLELETAMSFDKIDLVKVSCNLFYLESEGRLKLFKIADSVQDTDISLSWYIIKQLF